MSNSELPSKSSARNEASVARAAERLRTVLAEPIGGREQQWAESVAKALDRVESALRKHRAMAKDPEGLFASVDEIRPTLAKQADELRNRQDVLLDQVNVLRDDIESATASLQLTADPDPVMVQAKSAELSALRQLIEKFLGDLSDSKTAETSLVAESDNTDVGVGD